MNGEKKSGNFWSTWADAVSALLAVVRFIVLGCSLTSGCGYAGDDSASMENAGGGVQPFVANAAVVVSESVEKTEPAGAIILPQALDENRADAVALVDSESKIAPSTPSDPVETGRICVAPLDHSPTPGKGSAHLVPGAPGQPHYPAMRIFKKRRAVLGDSTADFSTRDGAFFDGLDLAQTHVLLLKNNASARPYARYKINFAQWPGTVVCVYDNAFYNTHQISDKPRRPYCVQCFKEHDMALKALQPE